jgi:hypothetical protein
MGVPTFLWNAMEITTYACIIIQTILMLLGVWGKGSVEGATTDDGWTKALNVLTDLAKNLSSDVAPKKNLPASQKRK